MRQYILTPKEKQIINKFLETGERLEGFTVLLHRCRNMKTINIDLELIEKFLKASQ